MQESLLANLGRSITAILAVPFLMGASPQSFVFSGRIIEPSGHPLEASSVIFTLEVRSPGPENCLLYTESHARNMSQSEGYFNIEVGSASADRTAGAGPEYSNSLSEILNNTHPGFSGYDCEIGNSYTPSAGQSRKLRLIFDDGVQINSLNQALNIQSVPYAEHAYSVGGKPLSELLQVRTADNLTQTNIQTVFSNFAELQALLNGSSTQYAVRSNNGASQLPSFASASPPATPAAGDMWYDSDTGFIKYHDGGSVQTVGTIASTGTVTDITIGGGLVDGAGNPGTTITTSGTIAMPAVGTAGTYTKVTTDAYGRVTAGGNLTESDIPALTSAGNGVDGGAISAGTIGGTTAINTSGNITTSNTVTGSAFSGRSYVLWDSDDTQSITINPPATAALTSNYTLVLPPTAGTAGFALVTDGTGQLSWVDISKYAGDYTASDITNVAAGNIAATDVQTALNELDSEKQPISAELSGLSVLSTTGLVERTGAGSYATIGKGGALNQIPQVTAALNTDALVHWNNTAGGLEPFVCAAGEYLQYTGTSWSCVDTATDTAAFHNGGDSFAATATLGTNDANALAFETNNTERARFSSGGNFGLGTTAPAFKVHSTGALAAPTLRLSQNYLSGTNPTWYGVEIYGLDTGSGDELRIRGRSTATGAFSDLFTFTNSGRLGIGTTNPTSAFVVDSGTGNNVAIRDNSIENHKTNGPSEIAVNYVGYNVGTTEFRDFRIYDGKQQALALFDGETGNVVIGTNAPNAKLTVDGPMSLLHQASDPSGTASFGTLYTKTDGKLYYRDQTGSITDLTGFGSGNGDFMADGSVAMTGALRSLAGTAANPGLSFTADTDTGVFSPSANSLAISTGGSERIRIDALGNIGVGTTTPSFPLQISSTVTDYAQRGILSEVIPTISTTGSYNGYGAVFKYLPTIGAGVTDSGSSTGIWATSMRNTIAGADDDGVLSMMRGLVVQYGHNNVVPTESPQTTNAYGVIVSPYGETGTITNAYDYFADTVVPGGAVTNHYGLYILGNTKKNYLGGNLGIGTNNPHEALTVQGAMSLDYLGADPVATAGYGAVYAKSDGKLYFRNAAGTIDELSGRGDFSSDGSVSMNGNFQAATGSASTPSLTFSGDTDTGIFRSAANELGFSTGGVERLHIASDGKIGVGTSAPQSELQVVSTQGPMAPMRGISSTQISDDNTAANIAMAKARGVPGALAPVLNQDVLGNLRALGYDGASFEPGADIIFRAQEDFTAGRGTSISLRTLPLGSTGSPAERLTVAPDGKVGIGTITPEAPLHVSSNSYNLFDRIGGGTGSHLILRSANGTVASPSPTLSGDTIGIISMLGYRNPSGFDSSSSGAGMLATAAENWTDTSRGSSLTLRTTEIGTSTPAPRLTILDDGRVGIGTTSPERALHIQGGGDIEDDLIIEAVNDTNSASGLLGFFRSRGTKASPTPPLNGDSLGEVSFRGYNAGNQVMSASILVEASNNFATSTDADMIFRTRAGATFADRMRITHDGYVGINTTSPNYHLDINGHFRTGGGGDQGRIQSSYEGSGISLNLYDYNDPSTIRFRNSPTTNNESVPEYEGFISGINGNIGVGTLSPSAFFDVEGDAHFGDPTDNAGEVRLQGDNFAWYGWYVKGARSAFIQSSTSSFSIYSETANLPMTFSTSATERMRITGTGNLGLGTTNPTQKMHVVGNLRVQGSTDCTLGNGSGGTNCSSDRRLKTEIKPIENPLEKILALKGVDFKWNALASTPGRRDIGVIAQDVEERFPTAVVEGDDGYKRVDYAVLVAPLIEAVKELWQLIRTQDEKIEVTREELLSENQKLRQQLEALTKRVEVLEKE